MGQLKAMMALQARGPQSVGWLGRTLGIAEPSASLLVDKLAEKGLVVRGRDADDRRRTIVTPTAAGRDVLRELHGESVRKSCAACARLSRAWRGWPRLRPRPPAPSLRRRRGYE